MSTDKKKSAQKYANICLDQIVKGNLDTEKKILAVETLVMLISNYDMALVPKEEVIPSKLSEIINYIHANRSKLSDGQLKWYRIIRKYIEKNGYITSGYQFMLMSFYIQLEGIVIEFEDEDAHDPTER